MTALRSAARSDILVVTAAGNHGCDLSQLETRKCFSPIGAPKGYPAGYGDVLPNLVVVAAVERNGVPARFTNFDSGPFHSKRVHVTAPGSPLIGCSDKGKSCG